jgi:hypothetical protein
MRANTNKSEKNYLPFGCLGALCFFGGLFIALGALSGEVKKDRGAVWTLVVLLLVIGGAGLFAAWKVRKQGKSAKPVVRPAPAPASPADQPALAPGEVRCPSCSHVFVPPRIMLVTEAVSKRFGPNPVQCPKCKHIWGRT